MPAVSSVAVKVRVIINPVSGGRRRGLPPSSRQALAEQALDQWAADGDVLMTEGPGHAHALAASSAASGADLVIAWGGDGTINEVASALAGTSTSLGIVRAGSGNGAARDLGIPASPRAALDAAFRIPARAVDTGEIDGRFFLNIAGIGLDASMARLYNNLGGELRGFRRYFSTTVRHGFGYRAKPYRLQVDGVPLNVESLVLAVANMRQYGNNAVIAATARPDDGELDLVVIGEHGTLGRLGLAARAFTRSMHRAPGVRSMRIRHLVIEADDPMAFHVDGECHDGGCRMEVQVRPGALKISGTLLGRARRLG
jgi:YegS/Rv2252/BmrU family lipid kinase